MEKAKAAAAAIPIADRLVTREELTEQTGMLRECVTQVKVELKQDFGDLRTDLKQDIGRLDRRIAVLNLAVFSFGPAIIALLVKLVLFP